jgi:hypothetical protein
MYSIINLGTWSWAYILVFNLKNDYYLSLSFFWFLIVILTLFSSLITSLVVGTIIQKRGIAKIGKCLKLNTIDPIETAWDWYFAKNEKVHILVTLKDDSEIAGWYGEDSFSSSIAEDRDLFIQKLYIQDKNGIYQQNPESKGFYIPKDSIKYIEFKKLMEVI